MKILLDTVDKVKRFVKIVEKFETDVYIECGRYIIDAKSIMGIFSVDLTRPLKLVIEENENCGAKDAEYYYKALEEFAV